MEIGNEISQKIRSAIKAKLVDLGAYVDDELPDYIMVMVANKKSQNQMTEDLNLFLGKNTEKFTAWLHGLLTKLKSVTGDGDVAEKKKKLSEKTTPSEKTPDDDATTETEKSPSAAKTITQAEETEDHSFLTIQPEKDEFAEEEQREAKKQSQSSSSKKPASHGDTKNTPPKEPSKTKRVHIAEAKKTPEKDEKKHEENSSVKDVTNTQKHDSGIESKEAIIRSAVTKATSETAVSSRMPKETKALTLLQSRKRKAPGSTIGAVVHHQFEEEEEKYDPHRPQIGKVASTVRVGLRRPTVPPSLQANRSLIMKAMTEAQTSVEGHKKTGIVEPMVESSVHQRLGRHHQSSRHQSSYSSDRYGQTYTPSRISNRSHTHQHESSDVGRSIHLTSRSRREERRLHNLPEREDQRNISVLTHVEDSRSAIVKEVSESEEEGEDILQALISNTDDMTDEELSDSRVVESNEVMEEAPPSPKFVVTLDGVDPDMLKQQAGVSDGEDVDMMDVDEESMLEEERARNIVRVKPQMLQVNLDSEQWEQEQIDEQQMETAPKKLRGTERCKFWPACKNGDECEFAHPSSPCRAFPKCKFGDKCLYLHPNCKFDAACTRPGCAFTHTTRRQVPPSAAAMPVVIQPVRIMQVPKQSFYHTPAPRTTKPQSNVCKFFPNCINMECPFEHPKPCRYGISCLRKDTCTFTHPDLPTKDKMTWTPGKQLQTSPGSSAFRITP